MSAEQVRRSGKAGGLYRGKVKLVLLLLVVAAASTALLLALLPSSRTRDIERIRKALVAYDRVSRGPDWRQMEQLERAITWVSNDRVKVSVESNIAGRPWYRTYRLSRRGDHWEVAESHQFHGDLGPSVQPR